MDIMRPDPTLYMSPEVMAMFNDGTVDVGNIFQGEFIQQQQQQQQSQQSGQPQVPVVSDQQSGPGGFTGSSFQKMNGIAATP